MSDTAQRSIAVTVAVEPGDCLLSIAEHYGFFWESIWNHPENAALKSQRADPTILLAGDHVAIPRRVAKSVECAAGRRHVFRRRGVPAFLRIQFFDGGAPRANEPYLLWIDGVARPAANLDPDGYLDVAIPCGARAAKIVVGGEETQETFELELAELDPIDTIRGLQGRLRNLGWFGGETDGVESPETLAAVNAFRAAYGLDQASSIDDATRDRLADVHGS